MYNEAKGIQKSLVALYDTLKKNLPPEEFEIVAVNDGSGDETAAIVSALCEKLPRLRLINLSQNSGKGGALKKGVLSAAGRFILFTDSDLAYGTDVILDFLKAFEEGKGKAVLGSRALAKDGYMGYSPLRKFLSKGYLSIIKVLAGFSYSDSQCGIKGFEKNVAHTVFGELETTGFAFDLEILLSLKDLGLPVCQIPVRIINHGTSSVHPFCDSFKMLRDLLAIKKRRNARKKQVLD